MIRYDAHWLSIFVAIVVIVVVVASCVVVVASSLFLFVVFLVPAHNFFVALFGTVVAGASPASVASTNVSAMV